MMKYLLAFLLMQSLPVLAEELDWYDVAPSGDSCTGGLLFSWHAENVDVTQGTPAGCSVGDTTATAVNSASISTDYALGSDGTHSAKIVTSGSWNSYNFDWNRTTNSILTLSAGTIDLWFRYSGTINSQNLFYLYVDGSNRIYPYIDSAGYIGASWVYGGDAKPARTTFPIISENTNYHCKFRWDTTAHSGLYRKVTCDTTTGESNSADTGTEAFSGTWSGDTGTLSIGDSGTPGATLYIDKVKIYNYWTATE
ncbi:MAG: hypothetical protein ACOYB1_18480 [Limnohabitans sp.]